VVRCILSVSQYQKTTKGERRYNFKIYHFSRSELKSVEFAGKDVRKPDGLTLIINGVQNRTLPLKMSFTKALY
jgi:hypothetical protein